MTSKPRSFRCSAIVCLSATPAWSEATAIRIEGTLPWTVRRPRRAPTYFARAARSTHARDRRRRPGHEPTEPRRRRPRGPSRSLLMAEALGRAGRRRIGCPRARAARCSSASTCSPRSRRFVWNGARSRARGGRAARRSPSASTRITLRRRHRPPGARSSTPRRSIAAGEIDVAAIVGAEAMKSRDLARRAGGRAAWHAQGRRRRPPAEVVFEVAAERGRRRRAQPPASRCRCTPTPSSSTRCAARAGRSRVGARSRGSGSLAARMSAVASTNR